MATLRSAEYGEAKAALADHPIVVELATELRLMGTTASDVTHGDGTPRWPFMRAANEEFRVRGGEAAPYIGTVAEAIIARL